ncbi:LCP family protein [Bacillus sp. FJAT-49705]|uniref:Regulatory protein MsrR n=1 Tax=Cytobacillus citreus TaxID=2833586 RepID=A0ABS5NST1_9BACI|nr:LCP family protein [Cytobacillus citreus]MBS4190886.1 LCP family protein [Cytobacillus citreus]
MKKIWMIFLVYAVMTLTACASSSSESNKNKAEDAKPIKAIEKVIEKNIPPVEPFRIEKKSKNFLLIGVDSSDEKASRSDTIMFARYEPLEKKIKLISLMRDSYVKIPNHPFKYSKLNHAYNLGGKNLLKETVEENFGVKVDHIAVIDFIGFVNIMDTIAPEGLDVEVSKSMIEDLNLKVEPGKQKLHGADLLSYVRFRHDKMSDFGRVNRQQEVLISLKEKVLDQFSSLEGIAKFPEVIKFTMQNVETDLKFDEAFSLGASFILNPVTDIQTLRVPVSNSFENKYFQHAGAVLKLNFEKNEEAIKLFLNEDD